MKMMSKLATVARIGLTVVIWNLLPSCNEKTIVEEYSEKNILLLGNSDEPKSLDPHVVSFVYAGNIIRAISEGLCVEDPKDPTVHQPGAAISWTPNKDFTEWTFQLQPNGKWSDGTPVTTDDFIFSYHRILTPKFVAKYASMLHFIKNAEDYNKDKRSKILSRHYDSLDWETVKNINLRGKKTKNYKQNLSTKNFKDLNKKEQEEVLQSKGLDHFNTHQLELVRDNKLHFDWPKNLTEQTKNELLTQLINHADKDLWEIAEVGVKATDSHTLIIQLRGPIPFLPDITKHHTWFPVPKHLVMEKGSLYDDSKADWLKPGTLVSNGAFILKKWKFNNYIEVTKNPHYWDKDTVALDGVRFFPISDTFTEARMFLAGQLHKTYELASEMVDYAKQQQPESVRQETYLGCNFLRFNVTTGPLADLDLRKAFTYSLDAQSLITNVLKGGQKRATGMVPPMTGYQAATVCKFDISLAKKHLDSYLKKTGKTVKDIDITLLTTSKDTAKSAAEAMQDMWIQNLGVKVTIEQNESTTYRTRLLKLDYGIGTGGWIGDYPDPTTFLDMWKKGSGNNRTGWHSEVFEQLLKKAEKEPNPAQRISILQKAENLFLNDHAILPIYWYTSNYLLHHSVQNWNPLPMNSQPLKFIHLSK